MARLIKSRFGLDIQIDNGVGVEGPNVRDDVGSVQFALRLLSEGAITPFGRSGVRFGVPGQGPIAVDGGYGPQTKAYIAAYQEYRKMLPSPGLLRGMPTPTGQFAGRNGGKGWDFSVLSSDAGIVGGRSFLEAMENDQRAPVWLKRSFFP